MSINPLFSGLGAYGSTFVSASSPSGSIFVSGSFVKIHTITATTFNSLSGSTPAFPSTLVSYPLPADFELYGTFSNVRLASGSAVLYNDSPSLGRV